MASHHSIIGLVRRATVVIVGADGQPHGTGFFVAPKRVVTASHVVQAAAGAPHVLWRQTRTPAKVLVQDPANGSEWPDGAILDVDIEEHPLVPLAPASPAESSDVFVYGFTRLRPGPVRPPEQDGSILRVELAAEQGAGDLPSRFHKVAGGSVWPGMSGGPTIDLVQYGVCGMTQSRSGDVADVGWAVPIDDVLRLASGLTPQEDLRTVNEAIEREDPTSLAGLRADQVELGDIPLTVASLITTAMLEPLVVVLGRMGRPLPGTVAEAGCKEWVARQLFDLDLIRLVATLKELATSVGVVAVDLFELVAPCVMIGSGRPAWWVSGAIVRNVRVEWDAEDPLRILHLCTDEDVTCRAVLRRSLGQPVTLVHCGGAASAAVTGAGTPLETGEDIRRALAQALGLRDDELVDWDPGYVDDLRADPRFFLIEGDDAAVFRSLASDFPGVPFLIRRRDLGLPATAVEVVGILPAIDPRAEKRALTKRAELAQALQDKGISVGAFATPARGGGRD